MPKWAGTYQSHLYQKDRRANGREQRGNGTRAGQATIIINAAGGSRCRMEQGRSDANSNTTTTPVADAAYLMTDTNARQRSVAGIFTFRIHNGGQQQDVFVTLWTRDSVASFTSKRAKQSYDYRDGPGLK